MKSLFLTIIVIISFNSFGQKAKLYETITYNQNGNSGSVSFKLEYDVFFGEPTVKVIAKVANYENCEPGLLDVAVDIYSGSIKVSTKTFTNLISIDIAASPNWDVVFPGLSAEESKDLFRNGFSIRNPRMVNLEFPNCDSGSNNDSGSTSGENEEESTNSLESINSSIQSISNEQNKAKSVQEQHEQHVRENNERVARQKSEQNSREQANRQAQQAKQQEDAEKRRAEQQRRAENQRKVQEHQRQVREQTERNVQQANAMAAANMTALVAVGMVMYMDMGKVSADQTYYSNQFYTGIDFGYSLSSLPAVFNSSKYELTYDYDSGDNEYVNGTEDDDRRASTINIDVKPYLGYEHQYGAIEMYGTLQPGFSIIFDRFNISHNIGGKIMGGIPNVKLMYQYERGARKFSGSDWITADEYGSLNSRFKYKKQVLGLRFSLESGGRNYARHHLTFGHIFENFLEGLEKEGETTRAWFYNLDPEKQIKGENAYYRIHGWSLEWTKEHNFTAYFNFYPNYPITGMDMYKNSSEFKARESGAMFFELGFVRQIKAFF